MKKIIVSILLTALAISMVGCNGLAEDTEIADNTESSTADTSVAEVMVKKDVVFSNHVLQGIVYDLIAPTPKVLLAVPHLEDEDTLYACYVAVNHEMWDISFEPRKSGESVEDYETRKRTYELEYIVNVMKEKGFMVPKDYPYCYYNNEDLYKEECAGTDKSKQLVLGECVIVGTYELFQEVFGNRQEYVIDGCRMTVQLASRPDYVEQLKQCGYTGEETGGIYRWSLYYAPQMEDKLGGEYSTVEVEVTVPVK